MNVSSHGTTAVVAPQIPGKDQQLNSVADIDPAVLAEICKPNINLAIWQRSPSEALQCSVDEFVASRQQPCKSMICSPADVRSQLLKDFGTHFSALVDDVNELVDMFCCLLLFGNCSDLGHCLGRAHHKRRRRGQKGGTKQEHIM